jgi:probable rRNA maturation factor
MSDMSLQKRNRQPAHIIDVQMAVDDSDIPNEDKFVLWANAALGDITGDSEITIRIVNEAEATLLNESWRHKSGPTNVLSFPAEQVDMVKPALLGDIVICAPVVVREARQQGKLADAHWAHMVIHGTLHLLGYDHIEKQDAESMESLEIEILNTLNLGNPYN